MAEVVFQKLQRWQDANNVTDSALAAKIGVHQTAISRAKRGRRVLGMEHQLALQVITKIAPADWAEFYAQTVAMRGKAQKKSAEAEPA